jgi:hypothetical protein
MQVASPSHRFCLAPVMMFFIYARAKKFQLEARLIQEAGARTGGHVTVGDGRRLSFQDIIAEEQIELDAKAHLLEQHGPVLPRPRSDVIVTSRHVDLKELRGRVFLSHHRAELRVLYAFDPRRNGLN